MPWKLINGLCVLYFMVIGTLIMLGVYEPSERFVPGVLAFAFAILITGKD